MISDEFVMLFTVIVLLMLIVCMYIWSRATQRRVKKIKELGYEFLWQSPVSFDALWIKDNILYFTQKHELKDAQVAEILGISEIRKGTKLIGLLIRYNIKGIINEVQIGGSKSYLLTTMDKLGYGV